MLSWLCLGCPLDCTFTNNNCCCRSMPVEPESPTHDEITLLNSLKRAGKKAKSAMKRAGKQPPASSSTNRSSMEGSTRLTPGHVPRTPGESNIAQLNPRLFSAYQGPSLAYSFPIVAHCTDEVLTAVAHYLQPRCSHYSNELLFCLCLSASFLTVRNLSIC